jgi:hypothetical protein
MPSSVINSDDGVISGTSGLKSSGGDDGVLVFQSKGTETARINTDKQIVAAAGTALLPALTTTGDVNTGIFFPAADTIAFAEGGAEAMRIDSSGNVIVLASGSGSLGKLTTRSDGGIPLAVSNESASGTLVSFQGNGSGQLGSITHSGSAVAYNTSSDYRLKHDIQPMTGALAKVAQLKPVTYKWNADDSQSQGFIAHELQEVVPGCVTGEKDAVETYTDEEGNEQTRPVYQGIDTSFLVATLTAAIQELKAELDELKARIAALEAVPGNE